MYKVLLFDLDGTLTDSSEGITKCVSRALAHFGMTNYSLEQLRVFIGPPLKDSFHKFHIPDDQIEEAITLFRERYLTVGKFENKPFPHVIETLKQLKNEGYKLYVATSKPEETAIEILKHFHMDHLFDQICGASFDHSRENKADVIQYLLDHNETGDQPLMIGDTIYDIKGARALGLPSIGVSWGFGESEEMKEAGALAIMHSMDDLYQFVTQE